MSSSNNQLSLILITAIVILNLLIVVVFCDNNNDLSKSENVSSPYPPFTDKEIVAIKQFREKVSAYLYKSYMKRDQYLIRWIRDSDFNLDAAKEKLLKTIKWRKENNIDTILNEDFSSLLRNCPVFIQGRDKVGRPLIRIGVGKCDLRKLALSGDIARFERLMAYVIESCADKVRQIQNSGRDIRDGIVVIDANGFNLRQHGCLRCIPAIFQLLNYYESYYPEYIYLIFVINVPRVAIPIIDIIIPTLSPKTKSVLKLYDYNRQEWEKDIRKFINPDQLPYQFGGNKNVKLQQEYFKISNS